MKNEVITYWLFYNFVFICINNGFVNLVYLHQVTVDLRSIEVSEPLVPLPGPGLRCLDLDLGASSPSLAASRRLEAANCKPAIWIAVLILGLGFARLRLHRLLPYYLLTYYLNLESN